MQSLFITFFTGAFLYACYSLLLISNKFCIGGSNAVMLLYRTGWGVGGAVQYSDITALLPQQCGGDGVGGGE